MRKVLWQGKFQVLSGRLRMGAHPDLLEGEWRQLGEVIKKQTIKGDVLESWTMECPWNFMFKHDIVTFWNDFFTLKTFEWLLWSPCWGSRLLEDDFDLPRKNRFDGNKTRISLETACGRKSDEKWWCPKWAKQWWAWKEETVKVYAKDGKQNLERDELGSVEWGGGRRGKNDARF